MVEEHFRTYHPSLERDLLRLSKSVQTHDCGNFEQSKLVGLTQDLFGSLHVSVATAKSPQTPLNKTLLINNALQLVSTTKLSPKELLFGTVKRLLTV